MLLSPKMPTERISFLLLTFLLIFLFVSPFHLFGESGGALSPIQVINGVPWTGQTWNNCGPANLAIVMNFWGWDGDQFDIASVLRPDGNDPHVGIAELAGFAGNEGFIVRTIADGNLEILKKLIAEGFPLVVPTWHLDSSGRQMGHYRTVYGYDDTREILLVRDTLEGPGLLLSYDSFRFLWGISGSGILVVEPTSGYQREKPLHESLPPDITDEATDPSFSETQRQALELFAAGVAASDAGNHSQAVASVIMAAGQELPWRIWWYFPRILSSFIAEGRYEDVLEIADSVLMPFPYSEELFFWLAVAEDRLGNTGDSIDALGRSASLHPGWLSNSELMMFSSAVQESFPGLGIDINPNPLPLRAPDVHQ